MAARWHARAARWIGVSNYTEAYAHWRRVVALIPDTEDSSDTIALRLEALRTLVMLAFRVETSEEDAASMFAAGQRYAQRLGDDASLAVLTALYGALRQNAGAIDDYLTLAVEASRIADRCGNRAARAAVGVDHFYALYTKGLLAESLSVAENLREVTAGDASLGVALVSYSPYVLSYVLSVWTLTEMGRFQEAELWARRGLELAQQHGPEESRCWAHVGYVLLADAKGDLGPGALNSARLAVEAAGRSGSDQARAASHLSLSLAEVLAGQWELAVAAAEAAIRISRTKRTAGDFAAQILTAHARALLGAGETMRAGEVSVEAIAVAKRQGQLVHECEATITHVRCLRELQSAEAREEIETFLLQASQLIEKTGAERWRPHVHFERGEVYRLTGDTAAARREHTEARRIFVEMGATGYAERLAKELGL